MAYHYLTRLEKYHIQWCLDNKYTLRKIAIALGWSVSTISRKIDGIKAKSIEEVIMNALKHMKNHIHTLTMDNGGDM